MGSVERSVIKFLVPAQVQAIGRTDLVGRVVIPLYLNPKSFDISESKLMRPELTKGGYLVQYWGEELATIAVNGSTGSGGIEAVHILRSVYRNEQLTFKRLLIGKVQDAADDAINSASAIQNIESVIRSVTSSAIEEIFEDTGVKSFMESLVSSTLLVSEDQSRRTELIPSLASFAVSVDLFHQGEKFSGYFENFNYSESASSPGLFDYSFSFKVLKRSGERKNFMPWHKNPYDSSGNPRQSGTARETSPTDNLSFPASSSTQSSIISSNIRTQFLSTQEQQNIPKNNVGISRKNKLKG